MRIILFAVLLLLTLFVTFTFISSLHRRLVRGFTAKTKIITALIALFVMLLSTFYFNRNLLSDEEMRNQALKIVQRKPLIQNFNQALIFTTEKPFNFYQNSSLTERVFYRFFGQQKQIVKVNFTPNIPSVICYLTEHEQSTNQKCIENRAGEQLYNMSNSTFERIELNHVTNYTVLLNRHGDEVNIEENSTIFLGFGLE